VVHDPGELGEDRSDEQAPVRDLDPEHPLDGLDVADAVDHGGDVVEAVGVGNDAVPVVRLRHLLETAVEVPDLSLGPGDPLAVHPGDEVDDPVRGRMRRADRDRLRFEVAGPDVGVLRPVRPPKVFFGEEPSLPRRIVLAKGVADERIVAEDPSQVRMAGETDPVEIERFPLEPVGARPDLDRRRHRRLLGIGRQHLDADVPVVRHRVQMHDDLETRLAAPAAQVVHAREIDEEIVPALRVVLEEARELDPVFRGDLDRRQIEIDDLGLSGERRLLEARAQALGGRGEGGGLDDRAQREDLTRPVWRDLRVRWASAPPETRGTCCPRPGGPSGSPGIFRPP
jgi:hypothetical protein